jgi:hypothetical protein
MSDLDTSHHFFRHIKKSWMDGDFVDPAAFRLARKPDGQFEDGLSVNWLEYFGKSHPQEAIAPLREILEKKGRRVGGESKFALLNVGAAKTVAVRYIAITIARDEQKDDPSHALVKGYQTHNDEVAEELAKVVIDMYSAKL